MIFWENFIALVCFLHAVSCMRIKAFNYYYCYYYRVYNKSHFKYVNSENAMEFLIF